MEVKIKNVVVNIKPDIIMFQRRMIKAQNKIKDLLREINVNPHEMEISEDIHPLSNNEAFVWWYVKNEYCYFSCSKMDKYIHNIEIIQKVLENEIKRLHSGEENIQDFVAKFKENEKVKTLRKQAREVLGLDENFKDFAEITKKYKQLSKELHPDTDNGDVEKFKELNEAHKILKRELE